MEAYEKVDNNSEDDVLMAWSAVCLFQLRGKSGSQQRTSLHSGMFTRVVSLLSSKMFFKGFQNERVTKGEEHGVNCFHAMVTRIK